MIRDTIEIDRSPADVFAYLDQLERHGEWQTQILEVKVETDGPTGVGTRAREKRQAPGGPREMTYEITEYDSPRRVAFRGLDGPIRPVGSVDIVPIRGGAASRVTVQLDLEGHGWGKLVAPLARLDGRRQIPKDQLRLKERLESGA